MPLFLLREHRGRRPPGAAGRPVTRGYRTASVTPAPVRALLRGTPPRPCIRHRARGNRPGMVKRSEEDVPADENIANARPTTEGEGDPSEPEGTTSPGGNRDFV